LDNEMPAARVADPREDGTPVVLYEGPTRTPVGIAWKVTVRPAQTGDGCPQWLKDVILAPDQETANDGAQLAKLTDEEENSCCLDSRDVTVWIAAKDLAGAVTITKYEDRGFHSLAVNFNLKKPDKAGKKRVQMNELWISRDPFEDRLDLTGGQIIIREKATGKEDPHSPPFNRAINPFAKAFAQVQCHNEQP